MASSPVSGKRESHEVMLRKMTQNEYTMMSGLQQRVIHLAM